MAQNPRRRLEKSKRYPRYIYYALAAAVLLLPAAGLAVWWWSVVPGDGTSSERRPGDILRQAGYLEILPPSRFHAPGTINTVENRRDGTIQLHPTCEMEEERLASLWHASPTSDRSLIRELSSRFDATADVLNRFASSAVANKVQNVTISFRNVNILLVSDEALARLQQEYIKGSCEQAIIINRYAGADVCQSEAVLEADLAYKVVYEEGLDDAQKAELTDRISASLNIGTKSSSTDEIRGDKLFYGVKLARNCIVFHGEEQVFNPIADPS